ncbi:Hsp20/alpha crystallin family protein [Planobacterium oryzisoli]|uniref:Hsp20/alpha crystallin family protein n=1 Tax=Planobacterium oryzisoli TaxID=2771435 RepID=A0A930YWN5_9FLAO|nr:Hsp20/alpha crystallin family protein [Planobacterium oryzisoli]MBF5027797.1 Hsp20/alpha crystallin family protein [Planobacterium oryzisoli]
MTTLMRRNSLFDDFFTKDLFDFDSQKSSATLPSVNVKECDNAFEIEFAAPGMKKENFKINLEGNQLEISAEDKSDVQDTSSDGRYTRREFNYSSFRRSFTIPESVDQENIEASYTDGILKVVVPKKEVTVHKAKAIEVK